MSLGTITEIQALGTATKRNIDFILAVPARRHKDLAPLMANLKFENSLAEEPFAGHRLVIAFDPERAAAQSAAREAKLQALEAIGERLADKLDAQDNATGSARRRACDRSAFTSFAPELRDRQLTRLIKIDWEAELFCFERNKP